MSRAKTKDELITSAKEKFTVLKNLIHSIDPENFLFTYHPDDMGKEAHWNRDKNLRDVLIHLYEWHQLVLNWVNNNLTKAAKPFLPESYTWKTYGNMNVEFWNKHQSTTYLAAKQMFDKSHDEIMKLIDNFTDKELFEKEYFKWSGTTNIGSYFISATASHYDWAIKKIKASLKMIKK